MKVIGMRCGGYCPEGCGCSYLQVQGVTCPFKKITRPARLRYSFLFHMDEAVTGFSTCEVRAVNMVFAV